MLGVINVRGDRLYHGGFLFIHHTILRPSHSLLKPSELEHIWWDQATVLLQAGIIHPVLPYPFPDGNRKIRLPISGVESAHMLADETDGKVNEMLGDGYGVID
jgi:hypothetical protein